MVVVLGNSKEQPPRTCINVLPLFSCSHHPLPESMAWPVVPPGDDESSTLNKGLRLSLYAWISPGINEVPLLPVLVVVGVFVWITEAGRSHITGPPYLCSSSTAIGNPLVILAGCSGRTRGLHRCT